MSIPSLDRRSGLTEQPTLLLAQLLPWQECPLGSPAVTPAPPTTALYIKVSFCNISRAFALGQAPCRQWECAKNQMDTLLPSQSGGRNDLASSGSRGDM